MLIEAFEFTSGGRNQNENSTVVSLYRACQFSNSPQRNALKLPIWRFFGSTTKKHEKKLKMHTKTNEKHCYYTQHYLPDIPTPAARLRNRHSTKPNKICWSDITTRPFETSSTLFPIKYYDLVRYCLIKKLIRSHINQY